LQISKHRHIPDQFGTRAEQGMNQDSALCIDLGELAVIVCPIEKLPDRGVARAFRSELLFDFHPFGHWIQPRALARQAGHVKLGAIVLVDITAIGSRELDPPLLVHPDCIVPSEHPIGSLTVRSILFHSVPLCSTMPPYPTSDRRECQA